MIKLGTNYGGWFIPSNNTLNSESTIISVGVGEDISFDLHLNHLYKSKIILIDPTNKAIKHFDEISNKKEITGNIQIDYLENIKNLEVDFNKFNYISKGLWIENTILKFYKQSNPLYVSQSFIENMFSKEYDLVETITFNELIELYGSNIDLLKLDIEGAEINVLNNMLDLGIYPKYLLVEFDLYLKKKDKSNETNRLIERIKEKYNLLKNDNFNITFELKH